MWPYTVTGASLDYPSSNLQVIWYLAISSLLNLPLRRRKGSAFVLPCDQPRCSASSSACEPAPLSLSRSSSPSPWHPQTPWQNDIHIPRYPRSHPTASLGASPWAGPSGCSHSWRALLHGKPGWSRSPPRQHWRRRWKQSLGSLWERCEKQINERQISFNKWNVQRGASKRAPDSRTWYTLRRRTELTGTKEWGGQTQGHHPVLVQGGTVLTHACVPFLFSFHNNSSSQLTVQSWQFLHHQDQTQIWFSDTHQGRVWDSCCRLE